MSFVTIFSMLRMISRDECLSLASASAFSHSVLLMRSDFLRGKLSSKLWHAFWPLNSNCEGQNSPSKV